MGKYAKMKEELNPKIEAAIDDLKDAANEANRVANAIHNVDFILDEVELKFEQATKLHKRDQTFLFVAIAIQVMRQYLLGHYTQRTGDSEAARFSHKLQDEFLKNDEYSGIVGARYRASKNDIFNSYSVPYDVTIGTKEYNVMSQNKGLYGGTHRSRTLGHDPLFGWVFGTCNIATNTLTTWDLRSFHVKSMRVVGKANTALVLDNTIKLLKKDPIIISGAVIKQGLHLASDLYSKKGIPVPGTVRLEPQLAQTLADFGIDTGNILKVTTQAVCAQLINNLIAMMHGMFYDASIDGSLSMYQIRTQKILMYSNFIASASNVIAVSIAASAGYMTDNSKMIKQSLNYLDIGGIFVTARQIVDSKQMIYNIKKEFLENHWNQIVWGDENVIF